MKSMEAVNCGTHQMKLTGSHLHNIKQSSALACHQAMQNNPSFGNCVSFESSYNIKRSHLPFTYCFHSSTDRNGSGRVSKFQVPAQKRKHIGKTCYSADICTYQGNTFGVTSHDTEEKIGVLLLNLGGPDTLQDVQPFLFNLFADPDIIRLPRLFQFLRRPLAKLISVARAPKSRDAYAAIGGCSPLLRITDEQANALKVALEAKNVPVNVYVGMRYWYPFTEEAIHQILRLWISPLKYTALLDVSGIKKDKITRLVVLPLYPQFSISTSGSSICLLKSIFREDSYLAGLPVSIIESWYERQGYIKSMADLIEKELTNFSKSDEKVMIFFSAHGVPVSYVEVAGDPYRDQMEECVNLIMEELKHRGIGNAHTLAYQSRVGPVQWLKPYTDEIIVELGQKGVKSLLAVPVSFVSEHIETLEEIDMEYRHLALESGIENWGRVPALGCTSSFILDLADAVIEALPSATAMPTPRNASSEAHADPFQYVIKMLFGSMFAFILLISPKLILSFKNFLP